MEAKELKEGGRYVRRNGSVTPPLILSRTYPGGLYDQETGWDYTPYEEDGANVFCDEESPDDLVAVYVEEEEAA